MLFLIQILLTLGHTIMTSFYLTYQVKKKKKGKKSPSNAGRMLLKYLARVMYNAL